MKTEVVKYGYPFKEPHAKIKFLYGVARFLVQRSGYFKKRTSHQFAA